MDGRTYWSPTYICEWAKIHKQTYYAWLKRGLMPQAIKIGNRKFYDSQEVERRLSRGE
ncbi:MAG TPA: hypothetical protein VHY35_10550 [Stellaceae bacterium]|nr:hypothetical protein [Stellaceae bacterium]